MLEKETRNRQFRHKPELAIFFDFIGNLSVKMEENPHTILTMTWESSHESHRINVILVTTFQEGVSDPREVFYMEEELIVLIDKVRDLINENKLTEAKEEAAQAMSKYPHDPVPHNLMGIALVRQGKQVDAMKHFRAAWALDSTYIPARENLNRFGTFSVVKTPVY